MAESSAPKKPITEYTNEELTIAVLKVVGVGILIAAVIVAPNLAQLYTYFKAYKREEQRRLYFKMRSLSKGNYIDKKRDTYILTPKGRRELYEDEVWNLEPTGTKSRTQGWHLVLYDIPSKNAKGRLALLRRLEELGYKKYQDSVYYNRQDMRSVLTPFAEFYGIRLHIRFLEVKNLEGISS